MKKNIRAFLKENFSFSAKEKRGMLVLAGILFCLLFIRMSMPYWIDEEELHISQDQWDSAVTQIERNEEINKAVANSKYKRPERSYNETKRYPEYSRPEYNRPEKTNKAININQCDSIELLNLKGIGAYTASKVIRYRTQLGGFYGKEQLLEIDGLRQEQIDTLAKYAQFDAQLIQRININTATENELYQHPYIRKKGKVLVRYRNQHGPYKIAEDLLSTGVIDDTLLEKIRPYLEF